jgi:hypothetical protein
VHGVDYRGRVHGVDDWGSVQNRCSLQDDWGSMDYWGSMNSSDERAAVVDDLATLGDGGLGADYGDGSVDHWGRVDGVHHGSVGDEEAGSGGGASQDSGEDNL